MLKITNNINIYPVSIFLALSLCLIFPNAGIVLLLYITWLFGLRSNKAVTLHTYLILLYLSLILSTKSLSGEGNDFITYFFNTKNELYPTWSDDKLDFLFWLLSSFVMRYLSGDSHFLFFFIINIVSFAPYILVINHLKKHITDNSTSKITSMFFLILLSSFSFWNLYGNYIRQAWVCSYTLGLLIALIEKRILLALICSIVVLLSHSTGVLFFAVAMSAIFSEKINLRRFGFLAIITCLICINFPVFEFIASFLPANIHSKLNFYSTWNGANFGETASLRLIIAYSLILIIDFSLIGVHFKEPSIYSLYTRLYYMFIILMIVISMVSDITKVIERLYYPAFILFYLLLSLQYSIVIKKMTYVNRFWGGMLISFIGIPLLLYSFYSSLYYNPAYFDGSITKFLSFSIVNYYD